MFDLLHPWHHRHPTTGELILKTLQQILDEEDQITAALTAETNAQVAVKAALDAKDAKIAALQQEITDAQSSGTPLDGDQIAAKLDAILNSASNAATAEAALANTTPAPATPATPVQPAPTAAQPAAAVPVLSDVSPAQAAAGATVTLTGTGFTGTEAINFGGAAVNTAAISVTSDTTTTVVVPPGSGQTQITLQTAAGTSAAIPFSYPT